jgi:hypothetical protein
MKKFGYFQLTERNAGCMVGEELHKMQASSTTIS